MIQKAVKKIEKCIKSGSPFLDLINCGLTDNDFIDNSTFAKVINQCTHISTLYLSVNRIKNIQVLKNLRNLKFLHINHNLLETTAGIENLFQLEYIALHDNQIIELKGFENLLKLKDAVLSNNKIVDIEPLIPFLKRKETSPKNIFRTSRYRSIDLDNNPLIYPPIEIVEQGASAILNYFDELEKQGVDYLYEAKMLIVGQPRSGKTSLRDKLFDVNAMLPAEDKSTRGIDIKRLDFDIIMENGKSEVFHCNIWDFGGQQIYQTTHQFFLTHRSLYILVIDTSKDNIGNDDNNVNYWLQTIELLGGSSPLLLVRNEKNGRKVYIDIMQKRLRFENLRNDYSVDLNALTIETPNFSNRMLNDFFLIKDEIQKELEHLPLVGLALPRNWIKIRNELQEVSVGKHYITKAQYIAICNKYNVVDYERQMELSRVFHDLGIFLHFNDYQTLENYVILQNTWATDAVFAAFDNLTLQSNKGKFTNEDISTIWKDKGYDSTIHGMLLALMMRFELCYIVNKSNPRIYIIPEMLSDEPMDNYEWIENDDLTIRYQYDFMPRGILTRLIVRLNKHIDQINDQQMAWKTGMKICGELLFCVNTKAEITEAWDNKQLYIRVQGAFAKDLLSKVTYEIDELNNDFFRPVNNNVQTQKSKWHKMIPCICKVCKNNSDKHFFDYKKLIERQLCDKLTDACDRMPFEDVSIKELLDGVFAKKSKNGFNEAAAKTDKSTFTIFLASSSELKEERREFEIFIGRENKRLNEKGVFLKLEIWEDFLDSMSQTRLQNEYNKVIQNCDVFVMLYFTKVGMFTAEEFETAFKQFKDTNSPKIYTYFKKGNIPSTEMDLDDLTSLKTFQKKLKDLGHFQTIFENDDKLHGHFKNQLARLYDI